MNRATTGRLRPVSNAQRLAIIVLLAAAFVPGCGKKGPPLPPLVKVPTRPDPFVARRLGSTVYVQIKLPTANANGTAPADMERIDVYGFTGSPGSNEDFFKYGTLVASIPVRKPPEAASEPKQRGQTRQPAVKPEALPPAPPRPPASMENGFDQGDTIVVTEPLGPPQFVEVVPKTKKKRVPVVEEPQLVPRPLDPPPPVPIPARLYVAVGINHKGQKGSASARQSVLLVAPASAPSAPTITYDETGITTTWTPPADAHQPSAAAAEVLASTPIGTQPVFGSFSVYEVPTVAPEPGQGIGAAKIPRPPAVGGLMPTPLNDTTVPVPPFVDKRLEFGKPRCYVVRAVTLFGTQSIEGEASPVACVTPVDSFAPAAPMSLKAVGSEGAISLIWEANKETDLAGYLVMRATLPGGEFGPVTPEPIKETTFNDTTVTRGVRYAYVVLAVDVSKNRSARSNQVEEAAR